MSDEEKMPEPSFATGDGPGPPADLEYGAGCRPNRKEQAIIKSIVAALDFATNWTGRAV